MTHGTVGSLADYKESLARELSTANAVRGADLLARVPGRAGHKLRAIGDVIASFTALHAATADDAAETPFAP